MLILIVQSFHLLDRFLPNEYKCRTRYTPTQLRFFKPSGMTLRCNLTNSSSSIINAGLQRLQLIKNKSCSMFEESITYTSRQSRSYRANVFIFMYINADIKSLPFHFTTSQKIPFTHESLSMFFI